MEQTSLAPAEQFITHRCPICQGVSHPATGCVYTPTFIVCGPCVREGWKWLLNHINGKGGRSGHFFYEHVGFKGGIIHDTP